MISKNKDSYKIYLYSILSGVLMGMAFPPLRTWFLIYPGLILMLHLMLTASSYRNLLKRTFLILVVFNIVTLYWISSWGSDDMFIKIGGILTILVHPLFFWIPLIMFYYIYRNAGIKWALIAFPFLWTGFEYFHNLGELAFPWIELGNTETYNLNRIQYAEIFGVHGITFLICVLASLFYYVLMIRPRKSMVYKIIILILFLLPYIYSIPRMGSAEDQYLRTNDEKMKVRASIIQTNIDPWKKWSEPVSSIVNKHLEQINRAKTSEPDIIVLHETAVPYYFFSQYFVNETNKFTEFANSNKINLLTGTPHMYIYPDSASAPPGSKIMTDGRRYATYNAAVLIEPNKDKEQYTVYSKTRLVPMSERTPYQQYLPFLSSLIKWSVGLSAWEIGSGPKLFIMTKPRDNSQIKFGTVICFESAFSEYVSRFSNIGAEFLVIITNDGWFGNSSGPRQHKQFSVLRAIENRKWVVRAAQTGISCYVDPLGNLYDQTSFNTQAELNREIIANNEVTFYAANGDITGKASMYLSILALIIVIIYQVYMKKHKSIA